MGALLAIVSGCQVGPPPVAFEGPGGLVRATAPTQALRVSEMLTELQPQVLDMLPDAVERDLEVWVQTQPALYRFEGDTYAEADGFWSVSHERIHLREGASSVRRTLAHELVHASLGASWGVLPGSLEEGLCDLISIHLVPEEATEMRAGRLSAAAFATGGLALDIEVLLPAKASRSGVGLGATTRVRLLGAISEDLDPNSVFDVAAGLSTTKLATNDKKALYGLSFLLVERIVERIGLEGLHELCLRATEQGHHEVPREWLLEAAELQADERLAWHEVIHAAMGTRELRAILMLYPSAVLDTAERLFGPQHYVGVDVTGGSPIRAHIGLAWSEASLDLGLYVEPVSAAFTAR